MPKGNNDLTQLASDASEQLGPIRDAAASAFKAAQMLNKSPNPKMAEKLAGEVEDLIKGAAKLKDLLKDLEAAT